MGNRIRQRGCLSRRCGKHGVEGWTVIWKLEGRRKSHHFRCSEFGSSELTRQAADDYRKGLRIELAAKKKLEAEIDPSTITCNTAFKSGYYGIYWSQICKVWIVPYRDRHGKRQQARFRPKYLADVETERQKAIAFKEDKDRVHDNGNIDNNEDSMMNNVPMADHPRYIGKVESRCGEVLREFPFLRPPGRPCISMRVDALIPVYDKNGDPTDSAVIIEVDQFHHEYYDEQDEINRPHDAWECGKMKQMQMCRVSTGSLDPHEQLKLDVFATVCEAATRGELTTKTEGASVIYVGYPKFGLLSPIFPVKKRDDGTCYLDTENIESVNVTDLYRGSQPLPADAGVNGITTTEGVKEVFEQYRLDRERRHAANVESKSVLAISRFRDHPLINGYRQVTVGGGGEKNMRVCTYCNCPGHSRGQCRQEARELRTTRRAARMNADEDIADGAGNALDSDDSD
eukprot:GHVU01041701.1.p1 GENE.GHVU01041701.1~~GHVU01041701.1.p1  ORF type:complete len:530 (-),score=68.36 GHVU01041701.1:600-1970(-)